MDAGEPLHLADQRRFDDDHGGAGGQSLLGKVWNKFAEAGPREHVTNLDGVREQQQRLRRHASLLPTRPASVGGDAEAEG